MSSAAVDAALDAALGDTPAGAPDVPQHTVAANTGPLTAAQAEALVDRALSSATTFVETMQEILDRRAWEPLGYHSPREFIRDRFQNRLPNAQGKMYSASYVRRMSNVAWMMWSIAEKTGVDPSDLVVPDKLLKQIPGGPAGENHERLLDTIVARSEEAAEGGDVTPSDVQAVIDSTMQETVDDGEVPSPPTETGFAPWVSPDDLAAADNPGRGSGAGRSTKVTQDDRYGDTGEEPDWQDAAEKQQPREAASAGKSQAQEAFDKAVSDQPGAFAPAGQPTFEETLARAAQADDTVEAVAQVAGFTRTLAQLSPQVNKNLDAVTQTLEVAKKAMRSLCDIAAQDGAEGVFDSLDEAELKEAQQSVEDALEKMDVVPVIAAVLEAVPEVDESVIEAERLAVVQKAETVQKARAELEAMIDEIDFLVL